MCVYLFPNHLATNYFLSLVMGMSVGDHRYSSQIVNGGHEQIFLVSVGTTRPALPSFFFYYSKCI